MITVTLPSSISSKEEAEQYLTMLWENGYSYHPDDPEEDILWSNSNTPSPAEIKQMSKLMEQVFQYLEDPCEILCELQNPPEPVVLRFYGGELPWGIEDRNGTIITCVETKQEAIDYCQDNNYKVTLNFN
jgi:hypothetical protein